MPTRYKPNCSTCKYLRGNHKLQARLYHAYYEKESGDETVSQIASEMPLSTPAVFAHMKNHTSLKSATAEEIKKTKIIEKQRQQLMKDLEVSFDHDAAIPLDDYEQAIDSIIASGTDRLKKGEITVSTSQLIAAAKIKSEYVLKKKSQGVELIKTMYQLTSGRKLDGGGSTENNAGVADKREGRPDTVHRETPWYPTPQGSEEVSPAR